jgi:prepilin-type N-terminal cleavage/methylation domain-containing protein
MATTTALQPLPPPSPRGHTFSTCAAPVLPSPRGGNFSTCRVRSAFTLVELLVVIGIIAILAALVTPAVMRAQATARNAAIKAEIDMLHMAIMNYKNQYGSFPPCYDANPAAPLTSGNITSLAQKHLQRLFPRCLTVSGSTGQFAGSVPLTPANSLAAWLSGYSDDPTNPLTASPKQKLYDFDQSRLCSTDNASAAALLASRLVYFPTGKPGSPYIYIVSGTAGSAYGTVAAPSPIPVAATVYLAKATTADPVALNFTTVSAERQVLATGTTFFNPDSFQILCAGRDEQFGTEDDLSNFWPGTRQDYLDSLKQ